MPKEDKAYHERKKSELEELAQQRGLNPRSNLRKHELVHLLQEGDEKGDASVAEVAEVDEEFGTVTFVGGAGQICDDLLPYQEEQAALVPGEDYSCPASVLRKLVINSNFQPADDVAEEVYYQMRQESILGERRAKRLLAGPATTGESARAFDRRMGIASLSDAQLADLHGAAVRPEVPEFDPVDDLEIVEGRVVEQAEADEASGAEKAETPSEPTGARGSSNPSVERRQSTEPNKGEGE